MSTLGLRNHAGIIESGVRRACYAATHDHVFSLRLRTRLVRWLIRSCLESVDTDKEHRKFDHLETVDGLNGKGGTSTQSTESSSSSSQLAGSGQYYRSA